MKIKKVKLIDRNATCTIYELTYYRPWSFSGKTVTRMVATDRYGCHSFMDDNSTAHGFSRLTDLLTQVENKGDEFEVK